MREDGLNKGNPDHAFTSGNQPTGEAKSKGKKKAKLLKDLANMTINDKLFVKVKEVAELLGLNKDEINIEMAMHMKQMQNAINDGDTKSYTALFDRLKGKPKQEIDLNDNRLSPKERESRIQELVDKAADGAN